MSFAFPARKLRTALGMLLVAGAFTGCRHPAPPPAPAPPPPPPITPSSITVITPLPSVPLGTKTDVQPAAPEKPAAAPAAQPVKQPRKTRRKPAAAPPPVAETAPPGDAAGNAAAAAPQAATSSQAINQPAADAARAPSSAQQAAPVLGELSTGTTIGSSDRTRMLSDIQVQEARLSKLKEPTTSDAQAVWMQIKNFLAKARQAVEDNDLDGAQTLNTKARVLLDELQND